jgi:beta-N-acetylhexosaminidase
MTAGAFILGPPGPVLEPDDAAFFRDADPWGFILFDRNLETPDQIRRLTASLREAVGRDAPILIDQEGGRVQRLRPPLAREWLPPLEQVARTGRHAARGMHLRYAIIAAELRALGIDTNCAPCADIAGDDTHPFLRNRCYGTDAGEVSAIARAVVAAQLAGGVLPVIKHMPGHGRGTKDSHKALPVVHASAETLRETDFAPFRSLADKPVMGMTAHVVYAALDPDRPATISPTMISLIRDEIGFEGLLMTDDLSMEALPGTIGARSAAAIASGCDVILHCNGDRAEMEAVVANAGRLLPGAEARAERALALRKDPGPIDIAGAEAELEALLQGDPA